MGRRLEKLQAAQSELGKNCYIFAGDVTKSADVDAAVAYAAEKMGSLDGAVNSAGSTGGAPIFQQENENFDQIVKSILYGSMYCMRAQTKYMIDHGIKGSIVNISSLNGKIPVKGAGPYNAAKAGLDHLAKTAALEVGPYGIRVNNVSPGFTKTDMTEIINASPRALEMINQHTPLRRWADPVDIANATLFLLSDLAAYVTGVRLLADGGMQHTAYPDFGAVMTEDLMAMYAQQGTQS